MADPFAKPSSEKSAGDRAANGIPERKLRISRRRLLELGALFGVSISVSPAPVSANLQVGSLSAPNNRGRFDALAKVTGAKTFTRDYRAGDLGWAEPQAHAFMLYADRADRRFAGLDLATRQAAQALLALAIIPAARSLWARGTGGGALSSYYVRDLDIEAKHGMVCGGGMAPLPLKAVAAEAHRLGLVTGVAVHTFNRWQWAEATFRVPGGGEITLAADALAVRLGGRAPSGKLTGAAADGWLLIDRSAVKYPPVQRNRAGVTYYTPIATFVELAVETRTGEVSILSHHSILECGAQLIPELVSGQVQGGLAMGIGHALSEYLPLYEDGPGGGGWNWDRYRLPRASDIAVWSQTLDVLPPLSATDPPKGMGEVVMIAIVPAIANAVHHAIGKRFYSFPLTPDKILRALG